MLTTTSSRSSALNQKARLRFARYLPAAIALLTGVAASAFGVAAAASAANGGTGPLAGAEGFTIVTFGDLNLANQELEGSVAVGGNLADTSSQPVNVIQQAASAGNYALPTYNGTPVRVVVAGHYDTTSSGLLRVSSGGSTTAATEGRMLFGDTSNASVAPRGAGVCVQAPAQTSCQAPAAEQSASPQSVQETTAPGAYSTLISNTDQQSLLDWNAAIAANQLTSSPATATWNGSTLSVTLTAGATNTLTLNANDLTAAGSWRLAFTGATPAADTPLLINVIASDGAVLRLPVEAIGMYPNGSANNVYAPYMLWNIDQASGSTIQVVTDGISPGSILAPRSNLIEPSTIPTTGEQNKGLVEGQIIANSAQFLNQGELHHYGFAATLAQTVIPTATPTPTPTATPTATPTPSPSATPTPVIAVTPTPTPTPTPSPTATSTAVIAPTATATPVGPVPSTAATPSGSGTSSTTMQTGATASLAHTGLDVLVPTLVAALCIAGGLLSLLATRRRTRASSKNE